MIHRLVVGGAATSCLGPAPKNAPMLYVLQVIRKWNKMDTRFVFMLALMIVEFAIVVKEPKLRATQQPLHRDEAGFLNGGQLI